MLTMEVPTAAAAPLSCRCAARSGSSIWTNGASAALSKGSFLQALTSSATLVVITLHEVTPASTVLLVAHIIANCHLLQVVKYCTIPLHVGSAEAAMVAGTPLPARQLHQPAALGQPLQPSQYHPKCLHLHPAPADHQ